MKKDIDRKAFCQKIKDFYDTPIAPEIMERFRDIMSWKKEVGLPEITFLPDYYFRNKLTYGGFLTHAVDVNLSFRTSIGEAIFASLDPATPQAKINDVEVEYVDEKKLEEKNFGQVARSISLIAHSKDPYALEDFPKHYDNIVRHSGKVIKMVSDIYGKSPSVSILMPHPIATPDEDQIKPYEDNVVGYALMKARRELADCLTRDRSPG